MKIKSVVKTSSKPYHCERKRTELWAIILKIKQLYDLN